MTSVLACVLVRVLTSVLGVAWRLYISVRCELVCTSGIGSGICPAFFSHYLVSWHAFWNYKIPPLYLAFFLPYALRSSFFLCVS